MAKVIHFSFKGGEFWQPSSPQENMDMPGTFGGTHKDRTELSWLPKDQGRQTKCNQPFLSKFHSKNVGWPSVVLLGSEGCRKRLWRVLHTQWAVGFLESFPCSCCPWQPAQGASTRCVPTGTPAPWAPAPCALQELHRGDTTLCLGRFSATSFTLSCLS